MSVSNTVISQVLTRKNTSERLPVAGSFEGDKFVQKVELGGTSTVIVQNGSSFSIPTFDYQALTYYTTTNNIETITFKSGGSGGTTVATLTFTYVNGAAADNDLIASITQT